MIHDLLEKTVILVLDQCIRKEKHLCVTQVIRKKNKTILHFSERAGVPYLVCNVDGEHLLGAADGVTGILYMLLSAMKVVEKLKHNKHVLKLVENSLERILDLMK